MASDYKSGYDPLETYFRHAALMQKNAEGMSETMDNRAKQDRDAAARMAQMKEQEEQAKRESIRSRMIAEQLAKQYPNRSVGASGSGGVTIGGVPGNGGVSLTPAQESAEKAVGKQIADYAAAGGRPAMEKNLTALQEVQQDLGPNSKRDKYDQIVGGLLSSSPALAGIFTPSEKERRDKARNTAISIAKATDPNPTEKQIETLMGQIYDPASTNQANSERIGRFLKEQQQKASQMEGAAQQYNRTGYATIGGTQPADPLSQLLRGAPEQAPQGGAMDAKRARLEELRRKKAGK